MSAVEAFDAALLDALEDDSPPRVAQAELAPPEPPPEPLAHLWPHGTAVLLCGADGVWRAGVCEPSASVLQVKLDDDGALHTVERAALVERANPAELELAEDLALLPHLGVPQLVHALGRRFARRAIYTWCGPALLALNPWRPLPLYDDGALAAHAAAAAAAHAAPPPAHVFATAAAALAALRRDGTDQTIIVSGESGAGKTESARRLLQALAHGSASTSTGGGGSPGGGNGGVGAEMQRLLLAATEVLEPLGSAFTARNPHSSRFGRLLSLSFTRRGGGGGGAARRLTGASLAGLAVDRDDLLHPSQQPRLGRRAERLDERQRRRT